MKFEHIPVLKQETIAGLAVRPDGVYVDCTVGGGGHAQAICEQLKTGRLIAIDQDEEALEAAKCALTPWQSRITFVHTNFGNLDEVLEDLSTPVVDGTLMDIGVSSHQLDTAARGFSYRVDAPLDMRMDSSGGLSAATVLREYEEEELRRIFWLYGEERWAARIAEFVVMERKKAPIETTGQLVEIIKKAVPKGARRGDKHPARRVFQALRIEVNRELDALQQGLEQAVRHLRPGGRCCVITFHSLEDRIVKEFFQREARDCICPPELPVCVCHHKKTLRIINKKPITAGAEELRQNARAHSAKLRIAEKIEPGGST